MLSSLAVTTMSPVTVLGAFLLVGALVLLGQHAHKEFTGAQNLVQKMQIVGQVLAIGLIPLFIAFLLVAIVNISSIAY